MSRLALLLVFLGGGLGSLARYLISIWAAQLTGVAFPFGTVFINAVGSFLISVVMSVGSSSLTPEFRLFLATGILGGFTTYSAFNYQSLMLFQQGNWLLGVLNIVGTVVICLAAGALGLVVSRWGFGA